VSSVASQARSIDPRASRESKKTNACKLLQPGVCVAPGKGRQAAQDLKCCTMLLIDNSTPFFEGVAARVRAFFFCNTLKKIWVACEV
jgi:hypothetical protein